MVSAKKMKDIIQGICIKTDSTAEKYFYPVSDKILSKIQKNFEGNIKRNEVVCFIDVIGSSSLFDINRYKKGILFTTTGVYFSQDYSDTIYINYSDIKNIDIVSYMHIKETPNIIGINSLFKGLTITDRNNKKYGYRDFSVAKCDVKNVIMEIVKLIKEDDSPTNYRTTGTTGNIKRNKYEKGVHDGKVYMGKEDNIKFDKMKEHYKEQIKEKDKEIEKLKKIIEEIVAAANDNIYTLNKKEEIIEKLKQKNNELKEAIEEQKILIKKLSEGN